MSVRTIRSLAGALVLLTAAGLPVRSHAMRYVHHYIAVAADREESRLWTQTLRAYRAAQWDQADVNLLNLQRANPQSTLYKAFSDIVAERRRNPPPADWDGPYA